MKCEWCGVEITPENISPEKVLNWDGEETWCIGCAENHTYICGYCDQFCAEGLHAEISPFGNPVCQFCIDDGCFDDDD